MEEKRKSNRRKGIDRRIGGWSSFGGSRSDRRKGERRKGERRSEKPRPAHEEQGELKK